MGQLQDIHPQDIASMLLKGLVLLFCVTNQGIETLFWRSSNSDGFTFVQLIPLT